MENILRASVRSLGERVCDAQSDNDVQPCIQISEFNHSAQWKDFVLQYVIIAFVIAFAYIGPAVVCLYSATQDTRDGICQIKVEGPSPVGFRSLIGNYFFSSEYTLWHRARKFIMDVVLLPIPFLVPAIFVEYLLYQNILPDQNILGCGLTFPPFRILFGCYFCNAFKLNILRVIPTDARHNKNTACEFFLGICFHRELPQRMLAHLRKVSSTISGTGGVCLADSVTWIKDTWRSHSSTPVRRIIVPLLFAPIFAVLIIFIIVYGCMLFMLLIFSSFPIVILCTTTDLCHPVKINFLHRYPNLLSIVRIVVVLLDISLSWLAALGAIFVLRSAAVGALIFLQLAISFVLSEDNLPFVACCVSVSHYLWNSYSRSFIRRYQALTINLYEHYDRLSPDHDHTTDEEKRIPKELFDLACEELMPIRTCVFILMVKNSLSTFFIFLIFSFTMSMNTSPMMKCLVTFLAGTFPIIVNIYLDGRKQNCDFDQKTLKIVQEYITSMRQVQRSYSFDLGYASSEEDTLWLGIVPSIISFFCYIGFLNFHSWCGTS